MANSFGIRLRQLMNRTGVKRETLAQAVRYDSSYISKWLSGKMLPSAKNADKVIQELALCFSRADEEGTLAGEYGCTPEQFAARITRDLSDARENSRTPEQMTAEIRETASLSDVTADIEEQLWTRRSAAALVDLFALPHEERLHLAGIRDGRFAHGQEERSYRIAMSMHVRDCVYDAIFLIHMLTSLSGMDFSVYRSDAADGKLVYAFDQMSLAAMLLPGDSHCIAYTCCTGGGELRDKISALYTQETELFRRTTLREMMANGEYAQLLISMNLRWLQGHVTECLLPPEVFRELMADYPARDLAEPLYQLSQRVLSMPETRILLYESAVADLVVRGEADLFNTPVRLTRAQTAACLRHLTELAAGEGGAELRLIDGNLNDEFQYITNPCVFLSDAACCLRLENGRYRDNILLAGDRSARELFSGAFEATWSMRGDKVISGAETVRERLNHYLLAADLMNS